MTAGEDLRRVRVLDASIDETIEIRWWRRRAIRDPDQDPRKGLTEIFIERHTAPPAAVWDARAEEPDPTV